MIRTSLWVKSTRVGELLGDVVGYFRGDQGPVGHWRGLAMFMNNQVTADDPRLAAVYDNYRCNLTEICGIARRSHAAVVLSTVAVNLRDFPPLASLHRRDLAAGELAKWESLYKAGGELEANKRWPEALAQYEAAAKIDDRFAELQFHIAECLMNAGPGTRARVAEARDRFELARDQDVLRFRADSRINAVIREVAGAQEAAGVRLADAEQALAQSVGWTSESVPENRTDRPWVHGARVHPTGIPGADLFYEHVHLTFDGNYLLARAVFDQVCAALPQLASKDRQGALPSRQRCAELLALTAWDEAKAAADMVDMTSGKPFANQFDHDRRQTAARQRRDDLRRRAATPGAKDAAWRTYESALAKAPDDWDLHRHFAALAMQFGRSEVAVEHFRIALEKVPWDASIHDDLGSALADQGQINEAISQYQQALKINPYDMAVHYNLGCVLAGRGQVDEAIACLQKSLEIEPDFASAHLKLAVVLAGYPRAGGGQLDEAVAHYQRALEINPELAVAHNNLGAIMARRGQFREAADHYRKAVEIKPDYEEAYNNLGLLLLFRKGAVDEAMADFQKAVAIKPDFAEAHYNLGVVLASRGQFHEAISHLQKVLDIKPDFAAARIKMAELRASHPGSATRARVPGERPQGTATKESGSKP
jgi:tetratricopeptide (TPR) repeat protein